MVEFLEKYILISEIIIPIISIAAAILLYGIISSIIKKIFNSKLKHFDTRKSKTLATLFTNIVKYVLLIVVILIILEVYGVDTLAILASLGIVGVVIGLALQDTLKDLLAGLFIISENQYAVGDIVEIGNFKGEVIALGLKSTKIRKWTGEIKILANRNITEAINYSLADSVAVVDISVNYDEDLNRVESTLNNLFEKLNKEIKELTGNIEIAGVQELADNAVIYRILANTKPTLQYIVERRLRKEIKDEFHKCGINIPYPQVVIHNGKRI